MPIRLHLLLAATLVLAAGPVALAQSDADAPWPTLQRRTVPIEGRFGDGWRQAVALPETPLSKGDQLTLWVERGWLCARLDGSDGQFDWQIVLCHIQDGVLPEVQIMDGQPFVGVSYRDGRYFIRESMCVLRGVRETSPDGDLLKKDAVFSPGADSAGYGVWPAGGIISTSWRDRDWFFVAIGPQQESWRVVVRLDPVDAPGGFGVTIVGPGPIHHFHGDTWLLDDGELLVATRTPLAAYEAVKKQNAVREAVLAGKLPAIDAVDWLNTEGDLTWQSLKGKAVLVDFWGTWCGACVAKLPAVQALHDKYADRGLAVVGVHSSQDAETCADYVKEHNLTFPVAVDSGNTAEAFAIGAWPSYFLVDRSGRLVSSYTSELPTPDQIETLLKDDSAGR
jgi:thiol-disulfide isomerase/thioredoxin